MTRGAPVDAFRLAYDRAGSGPAVAPSSWATTSAAASDAQLQVLDGVGHFVALQAPDAVAAAIRAATGTSA